VKEAYRKKGWSLNNLHLFTQCINEELDEIHQKQTHEGCRVHGTLKVNKVAGNFHIAPGKSIQKKNMHIHNTFFYTGMTYMDLSHNIHRLSFGDDIPHIVHPLDGLKELVSERLTMYQYFIKVVPTIYTYLNGTSVLTNQFSVTKYLKNLHQNVDGLPGVFFNYDIAPMRVVYTETKPSFMQFLTGVCAIVGGTFTVAGMLDAFIYHTEITLRRKIELGKQY
jgi:hypothetical protein